MCFGLGLVQFLFPCWIASYLIMEGEQYQQQDQGDSSWNYGGLSIMDWIEGFNCIALFVITCFMNKLTAVCGLWNCMIGMVSVSHVGIFDGPMNLLFLFDTLSHFFSWQLLFINILKCVVIYGCEWSIKEFQRGIWPFRLHTIYDFAMPCAIYIDFLFLMRYDMEKGENCYHPPPLNVYPTNYHKKRHNPWIVFVLYLFLRLESVSNTDGTIGSNDL